jgi:hypothetical protein
MKTGHGKICTICPRVCKFHTPQRAAIGDGPRRRMREICA